ncbi:MAG: hypothetical protein IJS37_03845 [Bacilli bacterium]|nr:hypothetical protein [Bacilli bacterium]
MDDLDDKKLDDNDLHNNLQKANDIIYGQLGYADVKLSFVLAASTALIAGATSGIVGCLVQVYSESKSRLPDWAWFIFVGVLAYVALLNMISVFCVGLALNPNTRTHGTKRKVDVKEGKVSRNQYFYGDIAKYNIEAEGNDANETVASKRGKYINEVQQRGYRGSIEDMAGQNIAVSSIILNKYRVTKGAVFCLIQSVCPFWFLVKIPWPWK